MKTEFIKTLSSQVRGSIILPGQAGYDAARAVYNSMHDRHPTMIVRAAEISEWSLHLNSRPTLFKPDAGVMHNYQSLMTCWCGDQNQDEDIMQQPRGMGEVVGQALRKGVRPL